MAKFVHGPNGYNNHGCRCDICKAGNAERIRQHRHRNGDEREEINGWMVHPLAPHGTVNGYDNYMCRCFPCRKASDDRQQDYLSRKRGKNNG